MEATAKNLEKTVEDLKQLTVEINRDRKNSQACLQCRVPDMCFSDQLAVVLQTRIGTQLTALETRWTELISSVLQIEMANVALEVELDRLGKREVEMAAL